MIKKICVWVIVFCLFAVNIPVSALDLPSLSVQTSLNETGTLEAAFIISENSKICGCSFNVVFDAKKLKFVKYESTDIIKNTALIVNEKYAEDTIRIAWAGIEEITQGGKVISISFELLGGASGSTEIKIDKFKMADVNGTRVESTASNATVLISETTENNGHVGFVPGVPTRSETTEENEEENEVVLHSFTDVKETDWFNEAVTFVAQNDYFQGVSENKFGPGEKMTRAMLVTVIGRIAGADVSGATSAFGDVDTNSWYGGFVAWATQNNIVGGVGNGVFAPDNNITREQIAVILMRYASYKGYSTDITSTEVYDSMTDTDKVSSYAVDAMKWATSNKIIGGSNGKLNSTGFATRSEVAQMIMNFCNTFNV